MFKKMMSFLVIAGLVLALAPAAQAVVIQSSDLGSGGTSIYTFTLDDNTTATTTWTAPAGVTSIDLAVVAGGGGGGEMCGGGGGAGGLRQDASYSVTPGTTYNIQVGAGGLGATWWERSNSNGDNSSFDSFESIGGGYGAGRAWDASTGGSGGGANGAGASGTGTAGQGYAGGLSGGSNGAERGAGGGGAGGVGLDASGTDFWTGVGGAGGIGVDLGSYFGLGTSIGDDGYFAGGGGGGAFLSAGSGGLGGGGAGGTFPDATAAGTNGMATTGGGGGGDYGQSPYPNVDGSGTGGSGIVILRFAASTTVTELTWTGLSGTDNLWATDANWSDTVVTGAVMTIDLAGGSDVKIETSFDSAAELTLGGTNTDTDTAVLTVDPDVTLTVAGDVNIADNGKFVSNVQGTTAGKIASTEGVVDISSVESLRVDWTENGASSTFGGVYTVAEYTGADLSLSGEFSNDGSNIGGAYVEAVDYSGGTVDVTLYQQKVGDVDLDGDVEFSDLSNLLDNWGIGTSWAEGDTDFSGDVVFADLSNLLDNWGTPLQSGAGAQIGVVPEPGTLMMLLVGFAGMLIYRKRR